MLRVLKNQRKQDRPGSNNYFSLPEYCLLIILTELPFHFEETRPKTFIKLVLKLQQLQGQISKVIKPPPLELEYLLIYSQRRPFQGEWDSEGFSDKLLTVIPLNSQGQTKKNGKPCKILVDQNLHSLL